MAESESVPIADLALKAVQEFRRHGEQGAYRLVSFLGRALDCQWGTYWAVDPQAQRLRPLQWWSSEALATQRFRRDTVVRELALNEGVPGQVWKTGLSLCSDDIIAVMSLPRSLYAKAMGMQSGLWIPVRSDEVTYGVVELLRRVSWPFDRLFVTEMDRLGRELGQACERGAKP